MDEAKQDSQTPPSCMGGWCMVRHRCALYHANDRSEPIERMCAPGCDFPIPLRQAQEAQPA